MSIKLIIYKYIPITKVTNKIKIHKLVVKVNVKVKGLKVQRTKFSANHRSFQKMIGPTARYPRHDRENKKMTIPAQQCE